MEPQVFDLLRLLAANAGRLVTRDGIVAEIWGGRIVSESAISARIAAARRAVGCDGKRQAIIRTVARRGLQMVAEVAIPGVAEDDRGGGTDDPGSGGGAPRIRYAKGPGGRSIAWAETGTGRPLLRLGDFLSDLQSEWDSALDRPLFEALSSGNRLIRFDPAGFGLSDRAVRRFSPEAVVEDALAVADAAGADRFAVYSDSGCHEALRPAAWHPERVSRMILVGGYREGRRRRDTPPRADPVSGMARETWRVPDSGFGAAFLVSHFPEATAREVRAMARQIQGTCAPELLEQLRATVDTIDNAELLQHIRFPVRLIHARRDAVHPLAQAQALASGLPDADLVVLDSANHLPLPTHPSWPRFLTATLDFMAICAAAPSGQPGRSRYGRPRVERRKCGCIRASRACPGPSRARPDWPGCARPWRPRASTAFSCPVPTSIRANMSRRATSG